MLQLAPFARGMSKYLYIETVGCQMNVLDSELVVASLRQRGYELTDSPKSADTILFNTCSVRQHAEDKIYSALGGSAAQGPASRKGHRRDGLHGPERPDGIFERVPYVDLVVGPGQLHQIPDLVEKIQQGGGRSSRSAWPHGRIGRSDQTQSRELRSAARSQHAAHPLAGVRADPDRLRQVLHLLHRAHGPRPRTGSIAGGHRQRIAALAEQGCREIILLGKPSTAIVISAMARHRLCRAAASVHEVDGIERIKFVTNYPLDMTTRVLEAVRDLPKCSPYLHVPAQSGSDRMLQAMKRGYTVADYREMMARIHDIVPGAAVSSDFIVGFCGETDEDFEQTVELVEECRFKNSFIFKYSERPGTKAADRLPDDVPEEVKRERNNRLLEIQNRICMEDNQRFIGQTVSVLVEGPSKAAKNRDGRAR